MKTELTNEEKEKANKLREIMDLIDEYATLYRDDSDPRIKDKDKFKKLSKSREKIFEEIYKLIFW